MRLFLQFLPFPIDRKQGQVKICIWLMFSFLNRLEFTDYSLFKVKFKPCNWYYFCIQYIAILMCKYACMLVYLHCVTDSVSLNVMTHSNTDCFWELILIKSLMQLVGKPDVKQCFDLITNYVIHRRWQNVVI